MERAVPKRRKIRFSFTNLAWLCPLTLLLAMPAEQISIYIRQFDLYIDPVCTYWGMLMFTAFLMVFLPLRRRFARGGLVELCYCLLPMTVLFAAVFAQRHFWTCLILILAAPLVTAGLFLGVLVDARMLRDGSWRLAAARLLLVVLTAALLGFAIPDICKAGFDAPYYPAQESSLTAEAEEEKRPTREALLAENPQILDKLSDAEWGELKTQERLDLLQLIADIEAESLGIPSVPVSAGKLEPFTLGRYSVMENSIAIDIRHLDESAAEECVETVVHETFHAYQQFIVDNLDWEGAAAGCAYFDQALAWKENNERYYSGGEAYYEQPLEVDARAYAEAALPAYCGEE